MKKLDFHAMQLVLLITGLKKCAQIKVTHLFGQHQLDKKTITHSHVHLHWTQLIRVKSGQHR